MPFAAWQQLPPAEAAREVHRRVAELPGPLRTAALAWLAPEKELARSLAAGQAPAPLRGVPYLLKDLFDVVGVPTHAGSAFLGPLRPVPRESAIVQQLRGLGAALAGKSHMVEFAAGLTGENRTFGDCPHPRFPDRLAGGSSSGSAALVAAGVAPFAIGTDTGGSVRVPAAFCGLYGYRHVPGSPLIGDAFPLSPTCDTIGWFTHNAADLAALTAAILGPWQPAEREPRGVYLELGEPAADPAVAAACAELARLWATPLAAMHAAALSAAWREAADAYVTIVMSDAHRVHRDWLTPYRAQYDPVIWQRFSEGGSFPPERRQRAREVVHAIRESFAALFREYDFVALPCAPLPAVTKAQCTPETRRAILAYTAPASLAGLPCLTLPVALPDGLSAGVQVIAPHPTSAAFASLLGAISSPAPAPSGRDR